MRQHGRENKHLVTGFAVGRDVVHLGLRLQQGENTLLGDAAVVIVQHLSGAEALVGDDHLEVIAVFTGDEQIQLERFLVLFPVAGTNSLGNATVREFDNPGYQDLVNRRDLARNLPQMGDELPTVMV